ncbi:hypothetical protein TNCV_14981 [Trichonephila clavipes]|nr:hypothetical protein TNCV_14981 [Trichonephila clavipes]
MHIKSVELKRPPVGVVVRRVGRQLKCRPRHLTMVQNYVVRRQSPRVAEQCDLDRHLGIHITPQQALFGV